MKLKLLVGAALMAVGSAQAATATFSFDLPATGLPSINPPYPSVATLTITDIAGGVQLSLDPNESSSGFAGDPNTEFVERLVLAYSGSAPTSFANVAGASLREFSFRANSNMDAGYASTAGSLTLDWFSGRRDGANRFDVTETSTFNLLGGGIDVSDFVTASANNKPGPIHGIISVTGYDLDGLHPTPSNWVDGSVAAPVPEPSTYALMLAGLGAVGYMSKRRKQAATTA